MIEKVRALLWGLIRGLKEKKAWKLKDYFSSEARHQKEYYMFGYFVGNVMKLVLIGVIANAIIGLLGF